MVDHFALGHDIDLPAGDDKHGVTGFAAFEDGAAGVVGSGLSRVLQDVELDFLGHAIIGW
jgi:hypothetical protein